MSFQIMIPARYASSRLPGKLLLELNGKPILQHTFERCQKSDAESILVLTDDKRIKNAAITAGADVMMTHENCLSGTDRIIEAIQSLGLPKSMVIVNVQGDEPLIHPELINQVAACVVKGKASMATLAYPIFDEEEINNTNVVKAVVDEQGFAKTFTRKPVANKDGSFLRHIGLYAYTAELLLRMADLPPSPDQIKESLEQLKVLHYGEKIALETACKAPEQDINTQEDYQKLLAG